MSQIVIGPDGEVLLAERAVRTPWLATDTWSARLFANDWTPAANVVLSDLTEATFPGYAPKTLTPATWNAFAQVAGQAQSTYGVAPLSWVSTSSPQVVYGYYLTDDTTGVLIGAERFDSPVTVTVLTAALVVPALSSRSQFEP